MSVVSLKTPFAALATILMLTNCSEPQVALEKTEREVFAQLARTLPTASTSDTKQTRLEVGVHRTLFIDLCRNRGHCVGPKTETL